MMAIVMAMVVVAVMVAVTVVVAAVVPPVAPVAVPLVATAEPSFQSLEALEDLASVVAHSMGVH